MYSADLHGPPSPSGGAGRAAETSGESSSAALANELLLMKTWLVLKQLMTCRPALAWLRRAELRDAGDAVFSQLTTKIQVLTTGLFKVDLNGVI